jgi:hypothetical protein
VYGPEHDLKLFNTLPQLHMNQITSDPRYTNRTERILKAFNSEPHKILPFEKVAIAKILRLACCLSTADIKEIACELETDPYNYSNH